MPYFLSQQALQKGLPHSPSGPGSRDTNAQCCHVADDEASNEQIHKIKDQTVDLRSELLLVTLAGRMTVEGSC